MAKKIEGFTIDGALAVVPKESLDHLRRQGLIHECARCGKEHSFKFPDTAICADCEDQMALDAGILSIPLSSRKEVAVS